MHIAATLVLARDVEIVPQVRGLVAAALAMSSADEQVVHDLCVAASEALTNAVEHAGTTQIVVELNVTGQRFSLVVRDAGSGFHPPASPEMPEPHALGGRGLALMDVLVDHVEVRSAPGQGTVVRLTHPLRGQAARRT